MADSPEEAVVEALSAEIDRNAGLPEHQTVQFTRPRIILPADTPLLVVWVENEVATGVETERVTYDGVVGISWHEAAVESVTDLLDDPDLERRLLKNMRLIKDRVHYVTYHGLSPVVEEVSDLIPMGWEYFTSPYDDGLTHGYTAAVALKLTDVPPDH